MADIFTESFTGYVSEGDTIIAQHEGFTLTATIHSDDDHGAPWDECYGHGPVSEWTSRDKRAGELVLISERSSKRFYDYAEACKIARRDEWGFLQAPLKIERDVPSNGDGTACGGRATAGEFTAYDPVNFNVAIASVYAQHRATMSPKQYAARAAMRDYEVLKAWCNDEWHYVGVSVTVERVGVQLTGDYDHALWGIDANYPGSDNSYLRDVANEYALEALEAAKERLASLCECDAESPA